MANQLTSNAEALRLFFTDDVFLVKNPYQEVTVPSTPTSNETQMLPTSTNHISEPAVATLSIPKSEPQVPTAKTWEFTYLGKNQKKILILVNDPTNHVSTKEGTELLRNLVKAINLTNNDFALVNYAQYAGALFEDFCKFFDCELLLSFGVEHTKLGLDVQPLHQLFSFGTTRLVFTNNLHGLHQDNASKKILWATLQQLK